MVKESGKRRGIIGLCCLALFFLIFAPPVQAARLLSLQIEQTAARWPEVSIWLHMSDEEDDYVDIEDLEGADIEVRVDGETLKILSVQSASEMTAHYYYLIDVSTSMTRGALDKTKEAILTQWENLRPDEEIVVISFGEEIRVVCDGADSVEEAREKLDLLAPVEEATRLFDGISKVVDVVSSRQDALTERNVVILVSDGIDYTTIGMTRQEVLDKLQTQGLILCAAGVVFGNNTEDLENMGELARSSGGFALYEKEDQIDRVLETLTDRLGRSICITASGESNRIENPEKTLSLTVHKEGQALDVNKELIVTRRQEDLQPPTAEIEKQTDESITLRFSEPVLGAEQAEHYELLGEEGSASIRKAEYDSEKKTATLYFSETLYDGEYTLRLSEITDASTEENPIQTKEFTFTVTDSPKPEEPVPPKGLGEWIEENIALCFGVVGLLLLGGTILCVGIYRTLRKKRMEKDREIMSGVDQAMAASANALNAAGRAVASEKKDPPKIYETCMVQLVLAHQGHPEQIQYVNVELKPEEAYYIGRGSDECDLVIDDRQLSRRHMALCWSVDRGEKHILLKDLRSTNGTWLNGVRVQNPRVLHYGDVITAGEIKLIVYFGK